MIKVVEVSRNYKSISNVADAVENWIWERGEIQKIFMKVRLRKVGKE